MANKRAGQSLEKAMAMLKKNYGDATIFKGSENITVKVETLSSGCLTFDKIVKVGGIPKGRILEIAGNEGSGKTVFSASVIAEWQKQGRKCAFIDGEQTADEKWFSSIGIDWDELLYARPDNLEQALDMIHTLASTGEVDLIVYDSIAALPSAKEEETEAGSFQVASIAKVLTPALRRLTPVLSKNECTLICINQVREKIGVMFGNPETTPGGRALKFAASLRLQMRKVSSSDIVDSNKETIGHKIKIRVIKNKLSSAQKVASEFTLYYNSGIDRAEDVLVLGEDLGIIEKPNNVTYVYKDLTIKGKGESATTRDNFKDTIRADENLMKALENDVREALFGTKEKAVVGEYEETTEDLEENMED